MTQVIPKGFKETEIGMIPEEWDVASFNDVSEIIGGGTPSTKNQGYFGGNIPWLTPKDLSGYSNKHISRGKRNITEEGLKNSSAKLIPKGTVLLTSRAPVGYVVIAKNEISTNQGFKSLICDQDKVHNYFMYYYLKNNKDYLEGHASGSTFKELSGGTLKKLQLPLPPLPQQKAIVKILSSLDDKIELLEKQNKTLENIGQAIFKSWFVDFEGFENDLVESEMGMIPRGWRVGKVGDYAKIKSGFAFKSADFSSEGINIIKIKNITELGVDLNKTDFVIKSNLPDRVFEFELEQGNILVAMSGNTTGKIAMMPKFDGQFLLNQRVGKFFMKNKRDTGFIYFYLSANNIGELILQTAYGSAQPNIAGKDIERFEIIIPGSNQLERFENISNDLIDKININIYQIKSLSNLRNSLLPRLMNGKVRV